MEFNKIKDSRKLKYTQIHKDTIKLFAQHELTDEASEILTEDVNYRLREIIGNAAQIMNHSRRKKLTIEDFNEALTQANSSIMFGNASPEPMKYIKLKNNLYSPLEEIVDLNKINYAVEGTIELKSKIIGNIIDGKNIKPKNYQNNGKDSSINSLTNDQITYYDAITKIILANNKETFTFIINDLRKSSHIQPILPFLLNFVYKGIEKYYNEFSYIEKSFSVLESLLSNTTLYFENENCLTLFMNCLIFCIVEPKLAHDGDHWSLRDHAVLLLVRFLKKWATATNRLYSLALSSLKNELNKPSIQFSSHYGILNAILILDINSLDDTFCYLLPNYLQLIDQIMSQKGNSKLKLEADNFRGILMLFCERLLNNSLNEIEKKKQVILYDTNIISNINTNINPTLFQKYQTYYKCFGDALAIRLPSLNIKLPVVRYKSIIEQNSKTNELILEMFKQEQDVEINKKLLNICKKNNLIESKQNNSSEIVLKPSDDEILSSCQIEIGTNSTNSLNSPNPCFIDKNSTKNESKIKEPQSESDKEMLSQSDDRLSLNKEPSEKSKSTPSPNDRDKYLTDKKIQSASDKYASQLYIDTSPHSTQDIPSQNGKDILFKSGEDNISLHIRKSSSVNDEEISNDKCISLLSSKESSSEIVKLTPKSEPSLTSEIEKSSSEKITAVHNSSESDSEMEIDELNNEHNELVYKKQLTREDLIAIHLNLSKMGSLMTIL